MWQSQILPFLVDFDHYPYNTFAVLHITIQKHQNQQQTTRCKVTMSFTAEMS